MGNLASVQSTGKKEFFSLVGLSEVRAITMTLPGVEEGPPVLAAGRIAAFKVSGKSFLGVEKGCVTMTVSLSEEQAKAVAGEHPDAYEEIWRNGKIFKGLRVDLSKVPAHQVRALIDASWMSTTKVPNGFGEYGPSGTRSQDTATDTYAHLIRIKPKCPMLERVHWSLMCDQAARCGRLQLGRMKWQV
jgi:YjbR